MAQQHGLLVVNKPRGLSSAQCVGRIKRLGQKKIGHAGTLDPMATGVLLVLLGQATKISGHLMAGGEKTYLAAVRLGQTTDTWDAEGRLLAVSPASVLDAITPQAVQSIVSSWLGASEQVVPPYSAAKHEGKPLYKLSLAGLDIPVKVKQIHISRAEVIRVDLPFVKFRITCSSGTYIRSLAHSLGTRLGCGAVLTELVREYSHPFGLDSAHDLEEILAAPHTLPERLLPLSAGLPGWRMLILNPAEECVVRVGAGVACLPGCAAGEHAVLLAENGAPLALAEARSVGRDGHASLCWAVLRGLW
ncbi:MAG: tRNA pseudouridine(55) synthase TruB [Deltaproteobacteria bacterium]|jgi:tRNA pseudouridine55 synthase|nr:tRNA pseudouridine(55) synthase TruB [Deltaproteobacteria bacterium]